MKTEKIIFATSIAAAAALTKLRLVGFDGAPCAAGAAGLGVANANYDIGEQAGVNVQGELLVEAGGAIAVGDQVESDAQGRVVTLAAGIAFGRARDAAAAAGELIRVMA